MTLTVVEGRFLIASLRTVSAAFCCSAEVPSGHLALVPKCFGTEVSWVRSVQLPPYQLARRCLTRATVRSVVAVAVLRRPTMFMHADKLAGRLWMEHRHRASKDVYAQHCNVCGRTFLQPEHLCRHAEHSIPADWASSDYSCYRHDPAAPHHTQFALYPSTPAHRIRLHFPPQLRAQQEHVVSSQPTAVMLLCHWGFTRRSRALQGGWSNGDRQCLVVACQLLCQSSVINWCSQFDHWIWRQIEFNNPSYCAAVHNAKVTHH